MRFVAESAFAVAVGVRLLTTAAIVLTPGYAHAAEPALPAPYLSRALDAVLLPITLGVRRTFKLTPKDTGVLVLAVEQGGAAASFGLEPGDVISEIKGTHIKKPRDVDVIVLYWIEAGLADFVIDAYRAGAIFNATGQITRESYDATFEMSSVATWESVSETSFSYSEYYSEYSEEITTSYETSETEITEEVSSSEVTDEMTADTDSDGIADIDDDDDDGDGTADAEDTDDDNDGMDDADEDSDGDGDGVSDAEDPDDDNDGVDDANDSDDDGDGVDDSDEGGDDE